MKVKILTCPKCAGRGKTGVAGRHRCPQCEARGWVSVPMNRADMVRDMTDEEMAQLVLKICRSSLNDDGSLFELWCDNRGGCIGENGEDLCPNGCYEQMQLQCILRYLHGTEEENESNDIV